VNNELTKTFAALTISDIATLAESGNLDDTHLADRLARRLVLEVRQGRGVLHLGAPGQSEELATLVEITDAELARI
jgi:hypothetical protein